MRLKYCLIFSSLSLLLACSEVPTSEIVKDAEKLIENQQYAQAEIKLKNGLDIHPDDQSLQIILATNYFNQGDLDNFQRAAVRLFDHTVSASTLNISPEYLEQFISFVTIFSVMEKDTTLLSQTISAFNCTNCQSIKGWIQEGNTDSLAELPNMPTAIRQIRDNEKSSEFYNSQDKVITTVLAYLSLSVRNPQAIAFYFAKLHTDFPNILHFNLPLAQALIASGQINKAVPLAKSVLQAYGNNPFANYLMAKAELLNSNVENSLKYSLKAQALGFANADASLTRGIAQYKLGQLESAINSVLDAYRLDKSNQFSRTLLISLYAQTGDIESALGIINQNTALTEMEINAFVASLLQNTSLRSSSNTLEDFAQSTQNEELNKALLNAAQNFKTFSTSPIDVKGEIQSGLQVSLSLYSLIANAKTDSAINLIDRALKSDNLSDESKLNFANIKGALLLNEKKYTEADTLYKGLLEKYPHNRASQMYLFREALRNLDFTSGQSILETILSHQAEDIIALQLYYLILEKNNESQIKLINILEKIQENPEHAAEFDLLLAGLHLKQGEFTKAESIVKHIDVNKVKDNNQYWSILFKLTEYPIDLQALQSVFLNWKSNLPDSPYPYLTYAKRLIELGNVNASITVLEQGNRNLGYEPKITVMLTSFYLLVNNYDEASKLLASALKDKAISDSQFEYFKAEIEFKQGKLVNAKRHLETSYKELQAENTAAFMAAVLAANGELPEALAFIDKHMSLHPEHARVLVAKGNMLLNSSPIKAAEVFQEIIDTGHKTAEVYNNLAWAQYLEKNYSSARSNIESALNIAPKSKAILNTYSHILFSQEDYGRLQTLSLTNLDDQAKLLVAKSLRKQSKFQEAKRIAATIKDEKLTQSEKAELATIKSL
ncbi:hypothetical protein [Alteromonas lipolytica]|uniref:PEP-CTERM system TPR-repeat protein PrsT n=1 Tax=Alteromonas lipolytica TaxID=1856405 RepID=A0A1E8FDT8_9ALTE|nr:hypothetical protein [Alteromonas lipolytica]OFI34079.1 hypothetical protein BFC17_21255 [Alteromonas lipolytica]GGF65603.1 hypothetical protein GCM10011338_17450 [Alteromonas lipolytica]